MDSWLVVLSHNENERWRIGKVLRAGVLGLGRLSQTEKIDDVIEFGHVCKTRSGCFLSIFFLWRWVSRKWLPGIIIRDDIVRTSSWSWMTDRLFPSSRNQSCLTRSTPSCRDGPTNDEQRTRIMISVSRINPSEPETHDSSHFQTKQKMKLRFRFSIFRHTYLELVSS